MCPGWELLQDREVLFPIRRHSAPKVPGHTRPYSGYLPTQGVSLLSPNWMSFPEDLSGTSNAQSPSGHMGYLPL